MPRLTLSLVLFFLNIFTARAEVAVGLLITRVSDPMADVRQKAAGALGRINQQSERTIQALVPLLRDSDDQVRYSAQWSLSQIAAELQSPRRALGTNNDSIIQLLQTAQGAMAETSAPEGFQGRIRQDRKSTRLNSSHLGISYAVFCLKKKTQK